MADWSPLEDKITRTSIDMLVGINTNVAKTTNRRIEEKRLAREAERAKKAS